MSQLRLQLAAAALIVLEACTPSLNWRVVRPEGAGVSLLFPCRPEARERLVGIAGVERRMQMQSCSADGATFSLAFVDVTEPTRVAPALAAMRAALVGNVAGLATGRPLIVPGATPNDRSERLRVEGRLPDGRPIVEHAAFFVRGLRLYQATALGDSLTDEAIETFFTSIKATA